MNKVNLIANLIPSLSVAKPGSNITFFVPKASLGQPSCALIQVFINDIVDYTITIGSNRNICNQTFSNISYYGDYSLLNSDWYFKLNMQKGENKQGVIRVVSTVTNSFSNGSAFAQLVVSSNKINYFINLLNHYFKIYFKTIFLK
jgi:hypothetical protein